MALVVRLLWGASKLAFRYVVVPMAVAVGTALVADALAARMRERTDHLHHGIQTHLDLDPGLQPAP